MTLPAAILGPLPRLHLDRVAQATLEWTLVLAVIAIPMYWVIKTCMKLLVAHFQMVTFLETVPFP